MDYKIILKVTLDGLKHENHALKTWVGIYFLLRSINLGGYILFCQLLAEMEYVIMIFSWE